MMGKIKLSFSRLPPLSTLALSGGDVHVWLVDLDPPAIRVQQMAQSLIENERIRAERFHFKRDKRRFIVRRAVLKMILGRYLQIDPNHIQFTYGPHGKPFLSQKHGEGSLRFNLAHSHELALIAFARGREIGVDVEYLRTMPDTDQIANRFFSPRENSILQALPESQRQKAFFNCWTRKEAYLKALGVGLSQALDQFEVSLIPIEPAHLVNVEIDCDDASRWTLKAFIPATGYVAAVAVEGRNWHNNFWQFPESTSEVCQSSQAP